MTTETNPIDLAEQLAAQQETAERNEAAREQFVIDFKWLMAHKQGRRIMWWLLSQTQVFRNGWRPDANETSFVLGNQNTGQQLLSEIFAIVPDSFTTMMREANDDSKRHIQR